MSDSSSHSLQGPSPNRSLAAFAQQPTSPFSSQQLDADSALAPPSMMAHRTSLYPQQLSGFEPEEQHVYRSVTMEAPSIGGANGFDPLASFDHSFAGAHHSKDLSMNPKNNYTYAAYQPTLNFATVQSDFTKQSPKTLAAVATKVAAPIDVLVLPPQAPVWLEPNSHFFCSCPPPSTPTLLFETVTSVLQSLHEGAHGQEGGSICTIDCTPTPNRYKLSCTAYQRRSGAATPFIVKIFTAGGESDNKYCVEFQRRGQSDVVHFYELFRTARTRIQTAYPCGDAVDGAMTTSNSGGALNLHSLDAALSIPQLTLRSWSAPPLPADLDLGFGVDDVATGHSFTQDRMCETVRSLLAMCTSPCFDVKLQGITALAELSASSSFDSALKTCSFDMREALITEGCFQLFLDCLPIESQDIHRASLTALANLVDHQSHLCKQLVKDEKSLARLYALSGSSTNQVVRECARFLSACASKLGPELLASMPSPQCQSVFQQTIQRLASHKDLHCREHAATINKCVAGTA